MPALLGPALVAAALLALAGAQKLLDPSMAVGALRALGLPSSPALVRAGSLAELLVALAAVVVGGAPAWVLVGASYLAFLLFVRAALRRGTPIGSCGCFGRADTAPHEVHLALNGILAASALAAAATLDRAPVDSMADNPRGAVLIGLMAAAAATVAYLAYTQAPPRQ